MATPPFNRSDVDEAIRRLTATGIPEHSESTRYDLVAPDGTRLPPKAVLSLAVEIATGQPWLRRDFSGGEETNKRLRDLGFEIRPKEGVALPTITEQDLKLGVTLSNDDIVHLFKVGNSGGMRWSRQQNCLVLIADHTKSLYDDRWEDGVLYYTGMGTKGDQDLDKQNKRLADQPTSSVVVHLFEVFSQGRYTYAGRVALVGEVSREKQPDAAGILRDVYVFPLKLDAGAPPEPRAEDLERIRQTRQRKLRTKTVEELRVLALAGGRSKPGRRDARTTQFDRDQSVVEYVKRAAAGVCDLCHEPAPFDTKAGPYLEGHHVQRLADGGPDIIENTVALCPNCHRRVHILRLATDLAVLRARIDARERPNT